MTDLIVNQSKIWEFVGGVSAMNGLVCFAQGSTYNMSFGKLGFGGHLVYLLVCLIMWCLMVWGKRIRVSERVQGVVAALIFVVISLISVVHDQLVAGKSDALTIISYGSFALMSVSMSRKYELGFETGFSAFFLQLFAAKLYKIKWFLLPIALVFCSLIIILRHHSESGVQSGPPNIGDEESQYSQGQSLLSTTSQENNPEESSEAMNHSPSNGQVSDQGSIFDVANPQNDEQEETRWSFSVMPHSPSNYGPQVSSDWENEQNREQEEDPSLSLSAAHHAPINNGEVSEESILEVVRDNQQNNDQEENRLSFPARHHFPSNYGQVSEENISDGGAQEEDSTSSLAAGFSYSSGSNQNGYVHSSPPPHLRRRRRVRMTPAIQNIASSLEDALRRWHRTRLLFFCFFKFLMT